MSENLERIRAGVAAHFDHVTEAAQALLAALVTRETKRSTWILCANVRAQETMHNELSNWFPDALFFPESERLPSDAGIADPENNAERLSILETLVTSRARRIVVATAESLTQSVPTADALRTLEFSLKRGMSADRETLIDKLAKAGFERVPQVSVRGQFAVRGGIVDIFSFQHLLPVRIELWEDRIESIRRFDLDQQTSVEQVDHCRILLGDAESATCELTAYIESDDLVIDAAARLGNIELVPLLATSTQPSAMRCFCRFINSTNSVSSTSVGCRARHKRNA